MKSIKEKAEENCIKYGSLGDIAYSEFVNGANYVLKQIEEATNICFDEELKRVVKQLKK